MKKFLLAVLALALAPLAFADTVTTFQFNSNLGDIGKARLFTAGLLSLTLDGFDAAATPGDMWMKNLGPTETGIGLADQIDHEISGADFVQIDITKILKLNPIAVMTFQNSIQPGESYDVFGSNTAGVEGVPLVLNDTTGAFEVPLGKYDFISIGGGSSGDVLLESVAIVQPTPEPGTLLLFSIGAGILIAAARKLRVAHG